MEPSMDKTPTDWSQKGRKPNGHEFRRARFRRADRILELRDAALELLYVNLDQIECGGSVLGAKIGNIHILLRTPAFSRWRVTSANNFMHGLDIWMFRKVLNIQWGSLSGMEIVSFRRGLWEEILLLEAQKLDTSVDLHV
jgi:hypothetical protein